MSEALPHTDDQGNAVGSIQGIAGNLSRKASVRSANGRTRGVSGANRRPIEGNLEEKPLKAKPVQDMTAPHKYTIRELGPVQPAPEKKAPDTKPAVRNVLQPGEIPSQCVWVGNVSPELTKEEFQAEFEKCGEVRLIRMFPRSKCAFVTFATPEAALASLALEGKLLGSMCLTLNVGKASRHLWVGNIDPNVRY